MRRIPIMTERYLPLIDDVAREMTSAEPRRDFQARVLDRISAERQLPAVAGWTIAIRIAVAAAAVLAIAVFVRNTDVGRPEPASPIGSATPALAASASPTPEAPPTVTPVVRVVRSAPDPAAERRASELAEWRGRAIPALIQPGGLSISQLSVTPLDIAPITIAPIGGEGGR
jgi:hypothetical protein